MSDITLERVEEFTSPTLRFLSGWLGVNIRPKTYHFSDGYAFKPKKRSSMVHDWSYILRGCTSVDGAKFLPYVKAAGLKPKRGYYINWLELDSPNMTAREGDPRLDKIRQYKGGLTSDPATWPEPYRTAYAETH